MLNLNSVMVGLQYLFLEPNADDPLNKGVALAFLGFNYPSHDPYRPQRLQKTYGAAVTNFCTTSRTRCEEAMSMESSSTMYRSTDPRFLGPAHLIV